MKADWLSFPCRRELICAPHRFPMLENPPELACLAGDVQPRERRSSVNLAETAARNRDRIRRNGQRPDARALAFFEFRE